MNITPIEKYYIGNKPIYVKREDLASPPDAPTFSKIRGLLPHIKKLKDQGFKHIGYTETTISMAGWGVAWACKFWGLKCIIYEPVYKCDRPDLEVLTKHRDNWIRLGAQVVQIPAGRAKINFYKSKTHLERNYPSSRMLPLGLPLEETIEETAKVANGVRNNNDFECVIVNVGSGTICSGLVRGMRKILIYGIMGRTGSVKNKKAQIFQKAGIIGGGGFFGRDSLAIIDPGYQYTEKAKGEAPFPCHPYYDLKAWNWLVDNIERFNDLKVLFWNIGS